MRYPKPPAVHREYSIAATPGRDAPSTPEGPLVLPGIYEVTLAVGGRRYRASLVVKQDPRVRVPIAALTAQLALERQMAEAMGQSHHALQAIDLLRRQLKDTAARVATVPGNLALAEAVKALDARAEDLAGGLSPGDTRTFSSLNASLGTLMTIVDRADAAPTRQAREAFASDRRELGSLLDQWAAATRALPDINRMLRARNLPEITLLLP